MKKFSQTVKQTGTKTRNYKKYVGVAAAAMIAFGTIGVIPTMATTDPTLYKIATFLGIDKDLASYETMVGQEVTKDGVAMKINEVIMSNGHLFVSVTTQIEEGKEEDFTGPGGTAYINGKEVNKGVTWNSTILEDGTGLSVLRFPLGEVPEGEVAVKLSLNTPFTNVEKSPHWNFEFKTNGDALRQDTQIVAVDKTFTASEGAKVTLNQYEGNKIEHRITYSRDSREHGFIDLRGTDEKGNQVVFEQGKMTTETGEFVAESKYNTILDEAQTLTLALYDNDVQVGESFEVKK